MVIAMLPDLTERVLYLGDGGVDAMLTPGLPNPWLERNYPPHNIRVEAGSESGHGNKKKSHPVGWLLNRVCTGAYGLG